jgi:P27 family predicted phage terminase small subunit
MTRGRQQVPKPPKELRPETKRWWRQIGTDYELESHHVRLLTLAAFAWDRAMQATEAIKADGAYVHDRYGCPKQHPALAIERDNRVLFARMLRELALDVSAQGEPLRPPGLGR